MNNVTSPNLNDQSAAVRSIDAPRARLGAIGLQGVLLLAMAYFIATVLRQPEKTIVTYVAGALFLVNFIAIVYSLVLTISNRQEAGLTITLYALFALGVTAAAVFHGRTLTASLSILTAGVLAIVLLVPRRMQKQFWIGVAVTMALMWTIEWVNPSWRMETTTAKVGPVAVIVFAILLVVAFLRQSWRGKIRTKLVAAFLATAIIPLVVLAFINNQSARSLLEEEALHTMLGYNKSYESIVATESKSAEALALSIADRADVQQAYLAGNRKKVYQLLAHLFEQWKDKQIVHLYIENPDGTVFLRVHAPEKFGDDITYRETAKTALMNKLVTSGVEIGPSRLGVRGVAPMYSTPGEFIGMTEVGLDFDEDFVSALKREIGADFTMWVSYDAARIPGLKPVDGAPAAPIEEVFYYTSTLANSVQTSPEVYRSVLETGEPAFQILTTANPPVVVYITPLLGYNNKVLGLLQISEPYTTILAARNNANITALLIAAALLLLTAVAVTMLSNKLVVEPVMVLSQFADKQSRGEIEARVSVNSGDEFESLAGTFNLMANSVETERQTLEARVADRTRNLELAAQVGRAVSQVRDLDVMLQDACNLILREFDLYYVQVYLADPSQTTLKLEAGTGNLGTKLVERGHSLPFDSSSINGRAAVQKSSMVISDTTQSPIFRQNPLLPETRGEMAVPLIIGDKVVGVLDMQSREPGVLSKEVLPAFEALAGQLTVAIQNSNLLAETEEARAVVEKQARRLVQAGWHDHLDAIHKPEQLGFVFDRKEIMPLVEGNDAQTPPADRSVFAPLAVTGAPLGSLVVEIEDESRKEQAAELTNAVARLVSQQIENLRLLESADRYRYEAERAARIQTLEGWQEFVASRSGESLAYLYDTNEVRPHAELESAEVPMFDLPLKARDEKIGKLSVQGLTSSDQESMELVSAVAERLSAHIENLRLFEETRAGQLELDKRARQLAAVAEISAVSSRELDIQKMLESVVYLTQRKFGLYHAHVFIYNQQTEILKIVACGWKEGDEHEGTHGTAQIPISQEQSLVARAGRSRQPVLINDVHSEPSWLRNPLLPDSAAELAVPLIIGDKLLGVLDVQADHTGAFSDEDTSIYSTLASQIATALQNAQSFAQAQQQAERESRLNVISQKIQSATTVEAVLQIAARELGHTLGAPLTIAQLGLKETVNGN